MEMVKTNGFAELSLREQEEINGGTDVIGAAIAFVGLCGGALIGGFAAGRAFVRDIKNKWFKD